MPYQQELCWQPGAALLLRVLQQQDPDCFGQRLPGWQLQEMLLVTRGAQLVLLLLPCGASLPDHLQHGLKSCQLLLLLLLQTLLLLGC